MGRLKQKTKKPENLILYYIYLAIACTGLGMGIIVLLILFCQYNDVNIMTHLWLLPIPIVVSLIVNVLFVELYRWLRNR
ncbi:MAG TPA: hypothetical protein VEH58_06710 [Dehalococcoidales bacterium]|nr:hypothetical protein [Dehalococcoidales bacterium]